MSSLSRAILLMVLGASTACSRAPAGRDLAPRESKLVSPPDRTPPAGAEKSASGLVSELLKPGSGDKRPTPHDRVLVDFSAWNAKGKLVDGSQKRGGPVTFEVTGVIAGWSEALQRMRVGERRRLWIPDELVYPGRPGFPRAMAVFELELLAIVAGTPPAPAPANVGAAPADAIRTGSGLAYVILQKGAGVDKPRPWDRVTIHHTGWTSDGAMWGSSRSRDRPSIFDVAKVIPGWREALQLLSVGDSARLWIPERLAYQGRAGEPKGALVFDIELVSIERRPEPPKAPADVAAAPRDARKTKSGLAYRMLRRGHGRAKPTPSDRVEVHYSAWRGDGELFDSSVVRGKPAIVPVSHLIAGWAEGVQQMVEGDKALFWIPEKLAYGDNPGSPRGMLVYEVELLTIVR